YGDTVSVEVAFTAGAKVGTGKVSFSSRFTGSVNGNLPYTTVSIVDFANTGVTTVAHNATLTGNGTTGSPLGVTVPLTLGGSAPSDEAVIVVFNDAEKGNGIEGHGGAGGTAVKGIAAGNGSKGGGVGVSGEGGKTNSANAGIGVVARGGMSDAGEG